MSEILSRMLGAFRPLQGLRVALIGRDGRPVAAVARSLRRAGARVVAADAVVSDAEVCVGEPSVPLGDVRGRSPVVALVPNDTVGLRALLSGAADGYALEGIRSRELGHVVVRAISAMRLGEEERCRSMGEAATNLG